MASFTATMAPQTSFAMEEYPLAASPSACSHRRGYADSSLSPPTRRRHWRLYFCLCWRRCAAPCTTSWRGRSASLCSASLGTLGSVFHGGSHAAHGALDVNARRVCECCTAVLVESSKCPHVPECGSRGLVAENETDVIRHVSHCPGCHFFPFIPDVRGGVFCVRMWMRCSRWRRAVDDPGSRPLRCRAASSAAWENP